MQALLSNVKLPKLLAPAGSKEAFKAALLIGADEIFLGLKQFNARKRANNFSLEDLQEIVPLAKEYDCKILVTLNVVIQQKEFLSLPPILEQLERLQIGGVIVQDLGVARIIRQDFPNIRMHASTQMAIHNIHGVDVAKELGFKRVVLAREMTLQEIKKIRSIYTSDQIELETFCHGSLCYSYSGLCFFSGAEGGRSGNRGECAYTCRKPYKILSEPGHGFLFSMKDLDTSEMVEQFIDAGIDSLKIEGRKKDAQYVATTVKKYRDALDKFQNNPLQKKSRTPTPAKLLKILDEEKSFSYFRSPTTLFYKNRYEENVIDLNNPTHQGIEIGEVLDVKDQRVSFYSHYELEAHDGIKIVSKTPLFHSKPQHGETVKNDLNALKTRYENREISFSLNEIFLGPNRFFSHPGNARLSFSIPHGLALPRKGDKIYKIRSNKLKRAIDQLLAQPLKKVLAKKTLQLQLVYSEIEKRLKWSVFERGIEIFRMEKGCQLQQSPSQNGLKESLIDTYSLLGNIQTALEITKINVPEYVFISKALLKEWKRDLVEGLNNILHLKKEKRDSLQDTAHISIKRSKEDNPNWIVKIDREELFSFLDLDSSIRPKECIFEPKKAFLNQKGPEVLQKLYTKSKEQDVLLRIALPLILRSWDEPYIRSMIRYALDLGIRHFECPNLGALSFLRKQAEGVSLDIVADFALYALNIEALNQLKSMGFSKATVSIEDDKDNIFGLLQSVHRDFLKVILFKDIPLFIAESCSLTALHNGCPTSKVCGYRTLEIEGEDNERYEVYHELCKSVVLSKTPFSLFSHLEELKTAGASSFQLDFLTKEYSFEGALKIYTNGLKNIAIPPFTTSNFTTKLL
jgi:putative protease